VDATADDGGTAVGGQRLKMGEVSAVTRAIRLLEAGRDPKAERMRKKLEAAGWAVRPNKPETIRQRVPSSSLLKCQLARTDPSRKL
jgi:hypothetical protein